MPKPSEWLIQNGWKPWNPNVHPSATLWVDPKGGSKMEFVAAVIIQGKRDKEPQK